MNYIGRLVKFRKNNYGTSLFYYASTIRSIQEQLENNGNGISFLYDAKQNGPIFVLNQYCLNNNEEMLKILLSPNNFILDLRLTLYLPRVSMVLLAMSPCTPRTF